MTEQELKLTPETDVYDPEVMEQFKDRFRKHENLVMGILAGVGAALVCLALWAVVAIVLKLSIVWVGVGLAFGVSFAIRFAGKGVDQLYGIISAAITVIANLCGILITAVSLLSNQGGKTIMEVAASLTPDLAATLISAMFKTSLPTFFLAMVISIAAAYYFAFKHVTMVDLAKAAGIEVRQG
ncbi:MAG: hypothetical protein GF398_15910 [Chitinivibrionales bacterium]|nr:hypothetical protein [Chitinivibrionales bacterium]